MDQISRDGRLGRGQLEHSIVLATGNPHKVEELSAIFAEVGLKVRLVTLREVEGALDGGEPAEVGAGFAENARIKAVEYARRTGRLCLADDSGLEVDALDGRPGVISSHYCTDGREVGMTRGERDAANNERVLKELAGVPEPARSARFVCCMCLAKGVRDGEASAVEVVAVSKGTMEGRVGLPPRVPSGGGGFGYDPLFLVSPGFERTSAELSAGEKHALSHRGKAARAMAARLVELLGWME